MPSKYHRKSEYGSNSRAVSLHIINTGTACKSAFSWRKSSSATWLLQAVEAKPLQRPAVVVPHRGGLQTPRCGFADPRSFRIRRPPYTREEQCSANFLGSCGVVDQSGSSICNCCVGRHLWSRTSLQSCPDSRMVCVVCKWFQRGPCR